MCLRDCNEDRNSVWSDVLAAKILAEYLLKFETNVNKPQEANVLEKIAHKSHEKGGSLVEFVIVAPALLLLGLGSLQMGLIYHAKTTLNYATFEAARTGSVNHALMGKMKSELGLRLAPVYGGDGTEGDAGEAIFKSGLDTQDPRFTKIEILNPTSAMFDAWGIPNAENGKIEIPNHHMRHQDASDIRADVNLADANLLKIRSTYGYRMQVPVVNLVFAKTLMLMNPQDAIFYASNRIPLTSVATTRMQNEAWLSAAISTNDASIDESMNNEESSSDEGSSIAAPQCDENGLGPLSQSVLGDDGQLTLNEPTMCTVNNTTAEGMNSGEHVSALYSQFDPCSS